MLKRLIVVVACRGPPVLQTVEFVSALDQQPHSRGVHLQICCQILGKEEYTSSAKRFTEVVDPIAPVAPLL